MRPATAFKAGAIPKAKNLAYTDLFTNHVVKDAKQIVEALKTAQIDVEKDIILYGNVSSCAARAALDSAGVKKAKIFETTFAVWKAADDEAKAKAAAAAGKKDDTTEPPKAPDANAPPAAK